MTHSYSADLSEKIIRGLTENALKGKTIGYNMGLGYRIDEEKRVVIDELEAPIVRRVFEMFAGGFKYKEITDALNEMGYKTKRGGEFNKNSIQRILKNGRYVGRYVWRDIEIAIPPLVSKELFERCQDKLKRVQHAPGRGKAKMDYLLAGKLFCGPCGANMIGESGTSGTGTKFYYYKCSARKHKKGCEKKTVKKTWIERLVCDIVYNEVLARDDVIEQIADTVIQIKRQEHDGSLLSSLEARQVGVKGSIKNILKLVEQGTITSSTNERLLELELEKEDLAGRIAAEKLTKIDITKDMVIFWLSMFKDFDLDDEESQRKIIDTFVHSAYLFDDRVLIAGNYTDDKGDRKEITVDELEAESDDKISISGGGGKFGFTPLASIRQPLLTCFHRIFESIC